MVLSRLPGQVQQRTRWDRQDWFSSMIGLHLHCIGMFSIDCFWYDTTVFALFKVLFTVSVQAWRKNGVLDFVGPRLMDSH